MPPHLDRRWGSTCRTGLPRRGACDRPRAAWRRRTRDSLYRAAREALNRYEYRRAAQLFRQLRDRHPRSEYAGDAVYWEAFALYRVGTMDDLRSALRVLESQQARYSKEEIQADAATLTTRIRGASPCEESRRYARDPAQRTGTVSRATRRHRRPRRGLSALSQMDARPSCRSCGACSRGATSARPSFGGGSCRVLGRRGDTASWLIFSRRQVRPRPGVRAEAISYLARTPGERVVDALETCCARRRTSGCSARRSAPSRTTRARAPGGVCARSSSDRTSRSSCGARRSAPSSASAARPRTRHTSGRCTRDSRVSSSRKRSSRPSADWVAWTTSSGSRAS